MADMKPEDDDIFDDADFEDLDPIEDEGSLEDDSWEDKGDGDLAEPTDDTEGEDQTGGDAPNKKTFVQKNFALIVGAVVVVFGGAIGVSMLGGNSGNIAPPPASPDASVAGTPAADASQDLAEMPPMPSPIDTEEFQPAQDAASAPGDLTPMPPAQDSPGSPELANLEVEEVPALPAGSPVKEGEKPFDFSSQKEAAAPELSPPVDDEPSLEKAADARPQDETEPPIAATAASQALEISKLQDTIKGLEAEIAAKDAQIEDAQNQLKMKDEKLAAQEKAAQKKASESLKTAPSSDERPVEKPVKKAARPADAAEVLPVKTRPVGTAPVVSSRQWVLKSAQSGKAVLSSAATGDTRDVKIGDKVDGLGQITLIDKENGVWTVRGTRGSVTR